MLRRSGLVCATLLALASAPSNATIVSFDTTSRSAVATAYTGTYLPLFDVATGWNGNVATCTEDTTSLQHQQATIDTANFYRVMAGLPQVNLITDPTVVLRARKAALMMAANGNLSHTPDSNTFPTCFNASGVDGARASNLALGGISAAGGIWYKGSTGPGAIEGYINDPGNGGETGGELGHRRWILYSKAAGFATGDIPNTSSPVGGFYYSANALRIMPNQSNNDGKGNEASTLFWGAGVTKWIAWPSPNFVPYQMIPSTGYWSVSYPGANFTAATVTMTTAGGANVPVTKYPLGPSVGYVGDPTLQFIPSLPSAPVGGMVDASYKIEVKNVTGAPNLCYTVTIFDYTQAGDPIAPDLCNPSALLPQSVAFSSANPTPVTVGDTYTPTATGSAGGTTITFGVSGACTLVAGQVTFTGFTGASNSSTCTVTASRVANGTYSAASTSQTITVNRKSQNITFDPATPTNLATGAAPVTVTATGGGSGNTITFGTTSSNTICTVSAGGTVTVVGVGTCVVTANQLGNNDWAAAPQATWTIAITAAALLPQTIDSITATPAPYYVGDSATLGATTTGGSASPVTFSAAPGSVCSASGTTLTFAGAGTCTITANQASDGTHTAAQRTLSITVIKKTPVITFPAQTTPTRTYAPMPGNTFALAPVATSTNTAVSIVYSSLTPAICSISGTTVTMITAGTCTIAANQAGNATYEAAAQQTVSIAITLATQTVNITSLNPGTATEGDKYTVTTSASSGLPVTLSVSGACTLSGSVVTFGPGAGTCTVKADQSGNGSYLAAPQATQTITVLAKQTLGITSTPPSPPIALNSTYQVEVNNGVAPPGALTYAIDPSTAAACTVDATGLVTFTATTGKCIVIVTAGPSGIYAPAQTQQTIYLGPTAGGGTAVPTLAEWTLALLAALLALLGLPALRRRAVAARR